MQVNLGLFSFNGGCGYLEKPASLCQSTGSFDPKGRCNVENVVIYQIDIKLISGQFFCQDREPTYVDIEMYGMYADATKRHEYRLRAKRWNGFQAVYDDTDVELGEFSIRFSKVILPEMASLRFAVSEEDGTFIGQSFIPVAHLRPGYRHLVLRNQMNIPVQSSSLYIYIRKDVHVDAENKELIDQLVSPTSVQTVNKEQQQAKYKPLSEQRSHSVGDFNTLRKGPEHEIQPLHDHGVFSPNIPLHNHPSIADMNAVSTGSGKSSRKRLQSAAFGDANWYQNQLIASSQLHDTENLCQELSLHDIEQTKTFKRKQEAIEAKARRASLEYDKVFIYLVFLKSIHRVIIYYREFKMKKIIFKNVLISNIMERIHHFKDPLCIGIIRNPIRHILMDEHQVHFIKDM
jgi:phosphatidylinositol phospholipase C beta